MDYISNLKNILTQISKDREILRNELRNYPDGKLMLFKNHGKLQKSIIVRENGVNKQRGIGRDPSLIHKLARKRYLHELDDRLMHNHRLISATLKKYKCTEISDIVQALPKHFDKLPEEHLITPAIKQYGKSIGPNPKFDIPLQPAILELDGQTPYDWGNEPYKANTYMENQKRIRMPSGLMVRSKSEAAIASLYLQHKIPFHYDEVLSFARLCHMQIGAFNKGAVHGEFSRNYEHNPRNAIMSPDFIAARKDGKLIYHEHFGLVDDSEYLNEAQEKLRLYAASGIVPWDNLIITYETKDGGIDLNLTEAMLQSKGLI